MNLTCVRIAHVRIVQQAEFSPVSGLNLIVGGNAAGKTSVLEALYVLGRGKTLTGTPPGHLTRHGEHSFQVEGKIQRPDLTDIPLKLVWVNNKLVPSRAGHPLAKVSELARLLPLQALGPFSYPLIEGGPEYRRRFLDWGVFHVKQDYVQHWGRFQRALRQRNTTLKQGLNAKMTAAWNQEFLETAQTLERCRRESFEQLKTHIEHDTLLASLGVTVDYYPGWNTSMALPEHLAQSLKADQDRGFTWYGPQRADLVIKSGTQLARNVCSRGEKKMMTFCLLLVQAHMLVSSENDKRPVILVDDISSELDRKNTEKMIAKLASLKTQTFITAIQPDHIPQVSWESVATFHVKQGRVSRVV